MRVPRQTRCARNFLALSDVPPLFLSNDDSQKGKGASKQPLKRSKPDNRQALSAEVCVCQYV